MSAIKALLIDLIEKAAALRVISDPGPLAPNTPYVNRCRAQRIGELVKNLPPEKRQLLEQLKSDDLQERSPPQAFNEYYSNATRRLRRRSGVYRLF